MRRSEDADGPAATRAAWQREELLRSAEHGRAEALRSAAEAQRWQAEVERLRASFRKLLKEVDARAARLARGDAEEFRQMAGRALRGCGVPPAAPGRAEPEEHGRVAADGVMRRLRLRIEQLERGQKRLEKENEQLRLQRIVAERGAAADRPSGAGAAGGRCPRAGAADADSERLQATVQRLQREQAEQQQDAGHVVDQLGRALQALQAENGKLQGDLRVERQTAAACADARRRLEREVRQLRAQQEQNVAQSLSDEEPNGGVGN